MNILEHYIEKVINKTPIAETYIDFDGEQKIFIGLRVKMQVDCYGNIEVVERLYCSESELNEDLDRGYYWG